MVTCYVCNGTKKSPYGDYKCLCCKGVGKLTEEQFRIKKEISKKINERLAEKEKKRKQDDL